MNEPLQNHYSPSNPNFTASPLYSKLTVHGGGIFAINKRTAIVPGIVTFIQGPHFQVNGGTSFRFDMSKSRYDKQSFQAGLWTRISNKLNSGIHSDAVILSTRFDYNKFGIGLSYDVNVSGLRKASPANNSFEFSFIYNICGPEKEVFIVLIFKKLYQVIVKAALIAAFFAIEIINLYLLKLSLCLIKSGSYVMLSHLGQTPI